MAANTRRTPVLRSGRKKKGRCGADEKSDASIQVAHTSREEIPETEACSEKLGPGDSSHSGERRLGDTEGSGHSGARRHGDTSECGASQPTDTGDSTESRCRQPIDTGDSTESRCRQPGDTGDSTESRCRQPIDTGDSTESRCRQPIDTGDSTESRCRQLGDTGDSTESRCRQLGDTGDSTESRCRQPGDTGDSTESRCRQPGDTGDSTESRCRQPGDTGDSTESRCRQPGDTGDSTESRCRQPIDTGDSTESEACVIAEPGPSTESEACVIAEPGPSTESEACVIAEPGPSTESEACVIAEPGPSTECTDRSSGLARDCRVRCCSKKLMEEVLSMYEEFSKELLGCQDLLSPGKKEQENRTSAWDFETAVQENISINGERWHDVVEVQNEPDIKVLEDQLDDAIVDTTMRRKKYPRKILGHVVKILKTQREMLGQYKPDVKPREMKLNLETEASMLDLTAMTTTISKQISETMKALPAQIEKADGFSQVLNLQPILEGSRTRREIFCSHVKLEDLAKRLPKPIENTPTENVPQVKNTPVLRKKRQRSLSPLSKLYPLRSKRKISLNR